MKIIQIMPVAIASILVIGGCSSQISFTSNTPVTATTSQQAFSSTSQPATAQSSATTSSSGQSIIITYSGTQTDQPSVGIFDVPKSGYIYELVTFSIINHGYASFSSNPLNFDIVVNNVEYVYDNATYDLQNPLPNMAMIDGDSIVGDLAFQVPIGTTTFKPHYNGAGTYNIQWSMQ